MKNEIIFNKDEYKQVATGGELFVSSNGTIYILARFDSTTCTLIALEDGNRFTDSGSNMDGYTVGDICESYGVSFIGSKTIEIK